MRRSTPPPAPADLPPALRVAALQPPDGRLAAALSLAGRATPARGCAWSVALVFMLLAKVATVYVPVIYGRIVDALAPKDAARAASWSRWR